MSRKIYKFVPKDFISFNGIMNYKERCKWEAISHSKPDGEYLEEYSRRCSIRKIILGTYNGVLVGGALTGLFFGIRGLAKLVSK